MQLEIQNNDLITKVKNAVMHSDNNNIEKISQQALNAGIDPLEVIELGFIEGMKELGDLFEQGDLELKEIISASSTMHKGINSLKPFMNFHESMYISEDIALWV